jgi:hypothetical protein
MRQQPLLITQCRIACAVHKAAHIAFADNAVAGDEYG